MEWEDRFAGVDLVALKRHANYEMQLYRLWDRGHTAEELVVDGLYRSWEKYGMYDPGRSSFQTWIGYCIRSCASMYAHKEYFMVRLEEAMQVAYDGPTPIEIISRKAEITRAEEFVKKIEFALYVVGGQSLKRDLDVLRTYQQMLGERDKVTQKQVAEELGITRQAVSASLKRIAGKCEQCGLKFEEQE